MSETPKQRPSPPAGGGRRAELVKALLSIVVTRGLDQVSVREVAAAADVAIGTVQHYFPTKDAMLTAAFTDVVGRIRERVAAVPLGPDIRANLSAVLAELLPLDHRRRQEVTIAIAFAARAATEPGLAQIQRDTLQGVRRELAPAFDAVMRSAPPADRDAAVRVALAAVDGLGLHAVSSAGLTPADQRTALALLLDRLLDAPG